MRDSEQKPTPIPQADVEVIENRDAPTERTLSEAIRSTIGTVEPVFMPPQSPPAS